MAVYFAQAGTGGLVKIGYAKVVAARLAVIQVHCADEIVLLRETVGSRTVEAWFHQQFRPFRVRNEWFAFDPAMLTLEPPWWMCSGNLRDYYIATHLRELKRLPREIADRYTNSDPPASPRAVGAAPSRSPITTTQQRT